MKKGKENVRGAGILLPISSLPSPYGIGTFGKEAYEFADQLAESKQKYWQVLPLGPTSYGDSPYQSFSAFAGNPYLIDLDRLEEEKLLKKEELEELSEEKNISQVDYEKLFKTRFTILRKAFARWQTLFSESEKEKLTAFRQENSYWLKDYCLYMTWKGQFEHADWSTWPTECRHRERKAIETLEQEKGQELSFWEFCQFKFYEQWKKLKAYINGLGIQIIGDIPLYVAYDSVDVWSHNDLFELDERQKPIHVAGVPPDYFSVDGQRWGNPLYDWEKMEQTDFFWWRKRMEMQSRLYDIIRIDHFIGINRYYCIPYASKTAREGHYRQGPDKKLIKIMKESIGSVSLIAEDLGVISDEVKELIKSTELPSMKVLLFAFDGDATNDYLPHNYKTSNIIVYGGTHDNETIVEHFENAEEEKLQKVLHYLGVKEKEQLPGAFLKLAYQSIGDRVVFQMQDILGLGKGTRINTPGQADGNWKWRMKKGAFTEKMQKQLADLVEEFNRE